MKKIIAALFLLTTGILSFGQKGQVKWYTIQDAEKLFRDSPRPLFIDTYTDWCEWCKKLDKDVFDDQVIAQILNEKYYPVKFDAESKDPVIFQGKTFINDGKLGKFHQLAYALLSGKMSFPTVVFLTSGVEVITPLPGYRSAADFEPFLIYFSGTVWQTKSFEDFSETFDGNVK